MKTRRAKILQWKLEWLSNNTSQQLSTSYDVLKADWPTSSLVKKNSFENWSSLEKMFHTVPKWVRPNFSKLCLVFYSLVTLFQMNTCSSLPYSVCSRATWKTRDVSLSQKLLSLWLLFPSYSSCFVVLHV